MGRRYGLPTKSTPRYANGGHFAVRTRGGSHHFHNPLIVATAHVIRDTIYMDGGSLWWLPGLNDGTYGAIESDRELLPPFCYHLGG